MNKLIAYGLFAFLLITNLKSRAYAMDPKIKAVVTMAAYGTVGGALLGTASLAFGSSGRAVAQGASLGLYAGLAFGAYVVVSHQVKRYNDENPSEDYYPETGESPYEGGGGGDEGGGAEFWNPNAHIEFGLENSIQDDYWSGKIRDKGPGFYIPLFQIQF